MQIRKTDFLELCNHIEYLLYHNKNYTKKQWYSVITADEILKTYKNKGE